MSGQSVGQTAAVPASARRGTEKPGVVIADTEALPDDVDLKIRDSDLRQRQVRACASMSRARRIIELVSRVGLIQPPGLQRMDTSVPSLPSNRGHLW